MTFVWCLQNGRFFVEGFCPRSQPGDHRVQIRSHFSMRKCRGHPSSALKAEDGNGNFNEVSEDDEMMELLRSFKDRKSVLLKDEKRKAIRLRKAACTSGVSLVLPDWVRRLDVDYPLAVCGSASEDVYVAHLETGQVLGTTATARQGEKNVPNLKITPERVEHVVNQLYGQFDGGGTLAVALKGSLVVESRRSGGVHVWRMIPKQYEINGSTPSSVGLLSQGFIPSLQDCLVTVLHLEDDYLWVGTDDGSVEAYSLDEDSTKLPLSLRTQPDLSWKVGSGSSIVMSLDVSSKIGCAVVATDTGTVELLSFDDDSSSNEDQLVRKPIGSFVPPFDGTERRSSNVYPTCATFVASSNNSNTGSESGGIQLERRESYAIACGANDGSIYLHSLRMDDVVSGEVDTDRPFVGQRIRQLMPQHFASVRCMANPAPGLLVTGGLDGTLRLWDTDQKKFLYQFVGYKVWLGSLWTDGEHIVTDGADNTIIMHDFSGAADRSGSNSPQDDQTKDCDDP